MLYFIQMSNVNYINYGKLHPFFHSLVCSFDKHTSRVLVAVLN